MSRQPRFLSQAVQAWPSIEPVKNGVAFDALVEPLRFRTSYGEEVTVPSGFESDGGSVPWWGRWLVNPAHHQRAWWIHDWAWVNHRYDHARLLDDALIADGCPFFHRVCIVLAVKIAGAFR